MLKTCATRPSKYRGILSQTASHLPIDFQDWAATNRICNGQAAVGVLIVRDLAFTNTQDSRNQRSVMVNRRVLEDETSRA
jgi:hypothetical protein